MSERFQAASSFAIAQIQETNPAATSKTAPELKESQFEESSTKKKTKQKEEGPKGEEESTLSGSQPGGV